MTTNKLIISSLSMDLKRVALSYHSSSHKTAERFILEALKRKDEIDNNKVAPYIKNILINIPQILSQKDKQAVAEDALMYSTIFQNYALK